MADRWGPQCELCPVLTPALSLTPTFKQACARMALDQGTLPGPHVR